MILFIIESVHLPGPLTSVDPGELDDGAGRFGQVEEAVKAQQLIEGELRGFPSVLQPRGKEGASGMAPLVSLTLTKASPVTGIRFEVSMRSAPLVVIDLTFGFRSNQSSAVPMPPVAPRTSSRPHLVSGMNRAVHD